MLKKKWRKIAALLALMKFSLVNCLRLMTSFNVFSIFFFHFCYFPLQLNNNKLRWTTLQNIFWSCFCISNLKQRKLCSNLLNWFVENWQNKSNVITRFHRVLMKVRVTFMILCQSNCRHANRYDDLLKPIIVASSKHHPLFSKLVAMTIL